MNKISWESLVLAAAGMTNKKDERMRCWSVLSQQHIHISYSLVILSPSLFLSLPIFLLNTVWTSTITPFLTKLEGFKWMKWEKNEQRPETVSESLTEWKSETGRWWNCESMRVPSMKKVAKSEFALQVLELQKNGKKSKRKSLPTIRSLSLWPFIHESPSFICVPLFPFSHPVSLFPSQYLCLNSHFFQFPVPPPSISQVKEDSESKQEKSRQVDQDGCLCTAWIYIHCVHGNSIKLQEEKGTKQQFSPSLTHFASYSFCSSITHLLFPFIFPLEYIKITLELPFSTSPTIFLSNYTMLVSE